MCGRFTSTASPEELMRKFGVTILQNLRPRWNLAPSQQALIISRNGLQNEAMLQFYYKIFNRAPNPFNSMLPAPLEAQ